MHSLMLRTQFIAQHYLVGKDFGRENLMHSHHYTFEVEVGSQQLDQYNYLIDIIDFKVYLDNMVAEFNDKILNDIPEFANQNPSLELFSKIIWQKLNNNFEFPVDSHLIVRLWEDAIAQASYQGKTTLDLSKIE